MIPKSFIKRKRAARINNDMKRQIQQEKLIVNTKEKIRKLLATFGEEKRIEIMNAVKEIYF